MPFAYSDDQLNEAAQAARHAAMKVLRLDQAADDIPPEAVNNLLVLWCGEFIHALAALSVPETDLRAAAKQMIDVFIDANEDEIAAVVRRSQN